MIILDQDGKHVIGHVEHGDIMILKEFFGPAIKLGTPDKNEIDDQKDDLFWYILDHDRLHKDYFIPLARKIYFQHKHNKLDKSNCVKEFMPMVEKGCLEFYQKKNMSGKPSKLFPKSYREDICEKLYDHYYEDIVKDKYRLGSINAK